MGILANSASKTQSSSSSDDVTSGYVVNEKVVLTTNPTGTNYSWAISLPSGSSPVRAGLSGDTGSSVTFKPDVGGIYTIVCTVDGTTTYTLRVTVVDVVLMTPLEALRLAPVADASIPAPPATVLALYNSIEQSGLVVKDSAGDIFPVELGPAV
jgi:hypothetical protein